MSLKLALSCLRDAPVDPDMWAEALPLITSAFGGSGACCFALNDQTGGIERASVQGPLSTQKSEYLDHYASLDLYLPIIAMADQPIWQTLAESLPQSVLQRSEWYQDFIQPSGIRDVVSVQVQQAGPHRVFFGIQYGQVQATPSFKDARLQSLLEHLQHAVRREYVQRALNLKISLGAWAIDHLEEAWFVTHADGRVIEMNAAAERILSRGNTLATRHGRLVAVDVDENRQLAMLMATAAGLESQDASMLVRKASHRHYYRVRVFRLTGQLTPNGQAVSLIRVVDTQALSPFDAERARTFGLSPAESRLAQALLQGKTLKEMTTEFGVRMPTLRSQMRSVLSKCGVERQVDLVRMLLEAG